MNRENLQRMADYIRTIPQEKFDMSIYRSGQEETPECDSIGCVVGHCTILDSEELPMVFYSKNIDFYTWSEQFTGLIKTDSSMPEWRLHGPEWMWCFDTYWAATDNTPGGAARRIEWLLKNGLPGNWEAQMMGEEPLCYM
jgi:hypothetical protein